MVEEGGDGEGADAAEDGGDGGKIGAGVDVLGGVGPNDAVFGGGASINDHGAGRDHFGGDKPGYAGGGDNNIVT